LDELEAKLQDTAAQDQAAVIAAAGPQLDGILRGLDEAVAATDDDVRITRRAGYLKGQGLELKGDSEAALEEFTHVRQFHDESPEGLAASLFEAELQRRRGDYPAALLGYRRVLESINPSTYRGYVVPLARVRAKALEALTDFVQRQRYDDARELLTRFTPLFSRAESLKFRGEMLQRWGESLLGETPEIAGETNKDRAKGLKLLREAGLAYEQLAEQRFTSETYTAYLWAAAENYYRGHSFTRATEMLNKFLDNESDLRNAQALLRLGQSHLALGKIDQSVAALEECIQFHPQDSATYQARIDCAKAYLYKGDDKRGKRC
jgi:tetratricopeptide (TPR) repeat protein